jgi:GntR family transcriptional regulator
MSNILYYLIKLLSLYTVTVMRYSIDHKSPIPLHAQAETLLRQLIAEEEYQNGKIMPNEVELAKMLAISRTTLRQAINQTGF